MAAMNLTFSSGLSKVTRPAPVGTKNIGAYVKKSRVNLLTISPSIAVCASGGGGFGSSSGQEAKAKVDSSNSENLQSPESSQSIPKMDSAEALEERIRNRRARRAKAPRVQVNSPAVDEIKGYVPQTPQQKAETNFIAALLFLFYAILFEGILVAGSGLFPDDWAPFIEDVLYPNFSPTVLFFLGMSSLYGLWKTGKVSLPFLGTAPPEPEEDK